VSVGQYQVLKANCPYVSRNYSAPQRKKKKHVAEFYIPEHFSEKCDHVCHRKLQYLKGIGENV